MSHLFNPTENVYPYRRDDTFKDSQVSFDPVNNILIVEVPVIYPRNLTQVSANYSILETDDIIEVTANTVVITPLLASSFSGHVFDIVNAGDDIVTVTGLLPDSTLSPDEAVNIYSNGTDWRVK